MSYDDNITCCNINMTWCRITHAMCTRGHATQGGMGVQVQHMYGDVMCELGSWQGWCKDNMASH